MYKGAYMEGVFLGFVGLMPHIGTGKFFPLWLMMVIVYDFNAVMDDI